MTFKMTAEKSFERDGFKITVNCSDTHWDVQFRRDDDIWALYGPATGIEEAKAESIRACTVLANFIGRK